MFLYPWPVGSRRSCAWSTATADRRVGGDDHITLVLLLWICDAPLVRWWGVATLAGVCYQGVWAAASDAAFGALADLHGCTAPLFFAMCVCLVSVTSPDGKPPTGPSPIRTRAARMVGLYGLGAIYLQIVLGAQVRHLPPTPGLFGSPSGLAAPGSGVLLVLACGLVWYVRRISGGPPMLRRRAWLLFGFIGVQFCLAWPFGHRFGLPARFRLRLGGPIHSGGRGRMARTDADRPRRRGARSPWAALS